MPPRVMNPASNPLKEARVGVICFDPDDKVIAVGVHFPLLVPRWGSGCQPCT